MAAWLVIVILFFSCAIFFYSEYFREEITVNVLGITDDEILIGSSAALGGHANFLGTQTVRGSLAYINEVNEMGGIYGRQIKLISYDDKYDPERTVENTKNLIGRDRVFALFDYVGTPTSVEIIDIVNTAKIPLVGLFTGAEALRVPFRPYIFNVRDSYYSEAEAAIAYFVDELGFDKVAVFYQNDTFGFAVLNGVELALDKRNMKSIVTATYERGTMDIESAEKIIKKSEAEAVIMAGTYSPLAKFVKVSNSDSFYPYFHTVSFVGSEAFALELIESQGIEETQYKKIIVTQVVPSPFSEKFPAIKEYHNLSKKYYPNNEPNYVALEGFLNAKVLVTALENAGSDLSRKKFIDALEAMKHVDIGIDVEITYDKNDHQGLDDIYYSRLSEGGTFELFDFSEVKNENF